VTRARDYCGVLRRLRVLVDGEEIGDVAYGQRAEFALEPGAYSLQVAMDWCRSEPYEVHVCPGEVVELEGGLRWRGLSWRWSLLGGFVFPGRMFVVRPQQAEQSRSALKELSEGVGVLVGIALTLCLLIRVLLTVFG
jgi:hypothetical protein